MYMDIDLLMVCMKYMMRIWIGLLYLALYVHTEPCSHKGSLAKNWFDYVVP